MASQSRVLCLAHPHHHWASTPWPEPATSFYVLHYAQDLHYVVPGCLTKYFLFPLSISVPTGPCHDPQMGWQVTACYSVYFASFNRCRCTRCWNVFPRSPQFLIILLKWLCICHHFHINIICFNCIHRAVQIICCERLIEFSSVCCLQIVPCLFTVLGSCWVTEVVQDISDILGWGGMDTIAYSELIWAYSFRNAMGHLAD